MEVMVMVVRDGGQRWLEVGAGWPLKKWLEVAGGGCRK